MDEHEIIRDHIKGVSDDETLVALRITIKEIHRLWMESPDWNQTDEGTHYLIQLFELGMK